MSGKIRGPRFAQAARGARGATTGDLIQGGFCWAVFHASLRPTASRGAHITERRCSDCWQRCCGRSCAFCDASCTRRSCASCRRNCPSPAPNRPVWCPPDTSATVVTSCSSNPAASQPTGNTAAPVCKRPRSCARQVCSPPQRQSQQRLRSQKTIRTRNPCGPQRKEPARPAGRPLAAATPQI